MRKTKKMQAGCLYLFKSVACSNTVYFEQLSDTQDLLRLAQQHLKDYLYVHEYMLCKDGWIFVARLKSNKQIQSAYAKKRARKGKKPKSLAVWEIVSEQMRLFIGGYVRLYNKSTEREGSLVKRPYERYYFEHVQDAKRMIRKIRRRVVGLQQMNKKYRAKKGHYRIPNKLGKGTIYLSSRRRKVRGGEVREELDLSLFQRVTNRLLTKKMKKTIKRTKSKHITPIPDI